MEGVLDEALEKISRTAPDFENGNTNHAPMVAETLVTIGRHDAVIPWVDAYRRELGDRPSERPPLRGDWREHLGRPALWPEWVGLFRWELSDRRWQDVIDVWASRLAPGISGAAGHGLIRTAHAARALGRKKTEPRMNELADALAYWAATYHFFGPAPPQVRPVSLDHALAMVPEIDPPPGDNIDQTLSGLAGSPAFAPVINTLRTGPDPLEDLSVLTERFAGVYLCNSHDPSRVFAVVHALTGPSALRLLSPYVTKSTRELLLLYAWQTAAAIYAVWAKDRTQPEVGEEHDQPAAAELTDASVANGAAHAIKFVEACLREHEHNPRPVYLAAARDAATRLTG